MPHKLPWDQTIWEGGWTPLGFNHRVEEMKEKTRQETSGENTAVRAIMGLLHRAEIIRQQ